MNNVDLSSDGVIHLRKFQPRWYQKPIIDAIENKGYKRVLSILPRRCLSGDSHITMADGSFKFLKDIKKGDAILSWDGERFVRDTVKHAWKTEKKKTKRVQAKSSLPIISSDDHVFANTHQDGYNISWSPIKDINHYRSLLLYNGMEDSGVTCNERAEFWGYMLADGYVSGYQQPKFTNTNNTLLHRVADLATKLFDVKVIWRKKGNGYDLGLSNKTKGGGYTKNPVKELFRNEGLDIPKYKGWLPKEVWSYSRESVFRFFGGILSADGNIYCHKERVLGGSLIRPTVEITINCGVSYRYAWGIYWLLRKVGIVPHEPRFERGENWKIKIGRANYVYRLLSLAGRVWGKESQQNKALETIEPYASIEEKSSNFGTQIRGARYKIDDEGEEELYDIETEKHHNFVANGYLVHNSGKDITAFNLAIRECLRKTCTIYYILGTYAQAKKTIWDAISNDGMRILDYIPPEVITSRNSQEMKVWFINGSLLQLIGSERYDTLMGTNPHGCIFSEYALQNPKAYQYIRPILTANNGWAIFLSTPRGKNHLWQMYQVAKESPEWYCQKLTVDDTQHISRNEIERERAEGLMSDDLINQEYFTSFERGVEGAYYSKYLDKMKFNGQITEVPHEPGFPVHTAWDLGMRDSTSIIFFQHIGMTIRIIETYENSKEGLEHYINYLQSKPYTYGVHIAPHDIRVKELGSGTTRWEKARQLGIRFKVAPNVRIEDGIECVRTNLMKLWIDESNAKQLVATLENYRQEYDAKRHVYRDRPLHDQFSHMADALRYMCLMLNKTRDGTSAEDLDQRYKEAVLGDQAQLPPMFRD